MKLKHIAAAALAVVGATSFAPAFASIDPGNDSELFLVVYDATASYTKDLGVTLSSFLGSSGLANTPASNFSFTPGATFTGTSLATSATANWVLLAVDADGVGDPGDFHLLNTFKNGFAPAYVPNGDFVGQVQQVAAFVSDVSQTGTHPGATTLNGESYNAVGTRGFWDTTALTNAGTQAGNAFGATSGLYFATNSSYDTADLPTFDKLGASATFNGTTLTVAVSAVPEADGIVMALAGLGLMGAIGRRRRAA